MKDKYENWDFANWQSVFLEKTKKPVSEDGFLTGKDNTEVNWDEVLLFIIGIRYFSYKQGYDKSKENV